MFRSILEAGKTILLLVFFYPRLVGTLTADAFASAVRVRSGRRAAQPPLVNVLSRNYLIKP